MKRAFLLKTFIAVFAVLSSITVNAQGNMAAMGKRLIVTGTGISGIKPFTYSSDATPTWGADLTTAQYQNVPLVLASPDITACGSLNTITPANAWVLIYRGNCEFGAKALAAQNAGAKGVIIVNNIPGAAPVGMGAGASGGSVTIPVLMVSNDDGNAMKTAIGLGTVTISLTTWGFGYAHDLAFVPGSIAGGHNGAIPVVDVATGSPNAYKFYTGAYIANTGSNTETNIKLKQVTTFIPTGGSASVVNSDSVTATQITVADSIIGAFSNKFFSNNQTQTGRYDITYTVSADNTDDNPSDNIIITSFYVTQQIFSKGRINSVSQIPLATSHRSPSANPNFSWGPLFYVNKGGYGMDKVVCSVSDNDTTKHALNGRSIQGLAAYVFKWVDGSNGGAVDGYMQSKELELKSIAGRDFTALDSNTQPLSLPCGNADGLPATVVLEDNTWYWVAVDVPAGWFIGCDDEANYFNRTNAAQNFATTKVNDYWAPIYLQGVPSLVSNTNDTLKSIPFGGASSFVSNFTDSIAFASSRGSVPAIALYTALFPASVQHVAAADQQVIVYPNPATDKLNVKFNLTNGNATSMRVIDGMGRNVYQVKQDNVKQGNVIISTSGFAPGNYYLLVGTEGAVISRPFTVASK